MFTPQEIDAAFLSTTEQRQNEIIDQLTKALPDDMKKAVVNHFVLLQWFNNPAKYNAVCKSMGEILYNELRND